MISNKKKEFLLWLQMSQLKLAEISARNFKVYNNLAFKEYAETFYDRAFSLKKEIERAEMGL